MYTGRAMRRFVLSIIALCLVGITLPVFAVPQYTTLQQANARQAILTIGSNTAIVDDYEVILDTPPMIISGRTIVPLRFIQEQLMPNCCFLNWDRDTRQITIGNIPVNSLDCEYVYDLVNERDSLAEENERLKQVIDELKRENEPLPEEDLIPPIEYNKNGIEFTLKSVTKERGPIDDGERSYYLRLNVKIKNNHSQSSCRFPASLTKMVVEGDEYGQTDYDKTYRNSIPAGGEMSGWIRFPLITSQKTVSFKFVMWPSDTINHFDFFMKVDLGEAIPNSIHHLPK
jgi:hypothetical protein